ncbi:hypothetical protein FRC03_011860 [Tulasnella sp. 419]|nr:hypothetical protein FRC03_011860 [Tulasnella sp. 419]
MLVLYAETAAVTLVVVFMTTAIVIYLSHRQLHKAPKLPVETQRVPEDIVEDTKTRSSLEQSSKKRKERKRRGKGKEKAPTVDDVMPSLQIRSQKPIDGQDAWYLSASEQVRVSSPSSSVSTSTATTFQSSTVPLTPPQSSTILPHPQLNDDNGHAYAHVIPFSDVHPPPDLPLPTSSNFTRLPAQPPSPQEPPKLRKPKLRKDVSVALPTSVRKSPSQDHQSRDTAGSSRPAPASHPLSITENSDVSGSTSNMVQVATDISSRSRSTSGAPESITPYTSSHVRDQRFSPSNQRDRDFAQSRLPPRHRKQGLRPSELAQTYQPHFSDQPQSVPGMAIPSPFQQPLLHPSTPFDQYPYPVHTLRLSQPLLPPGYTFPLPVSPSQFQTPFAPFPPLQVSRPISPLPQTSNSHSTSSNEPSEGNNVMDDGQEIVFPSLHPTISRQSTGYPGSKKENEMMVKTDGDSLATIDVVPEIRILEGSQTAHMVDHSPSNVESNDVGTWHGPTHNGVIVPPDVVTWYSTSSALPGSRFVMSPYSTHGDHVSGAVSKIGGLPMTVFDDRVERPLSPSSRSDSSFGCSDRLSTLETDSHHHRQHSSSGAAPVDLSAIHPPSYVLPQTFGQGPAYPTISPQFSSPSYHPQGVTVTTPIQYHGFIEQGLHIELKRPPYAHTSNPHSQMSSPGCTVPVGSHSWFSASSDTSGSVSERLLGAIFKNPTTFSLEACHSTKNPEKARGNSGIQPSPSKSPKDTTKLPSQY